ncbi:GDP-fucose transporter nac isoform X2 [Tachypleus tridentatus]|uniref:GDP-fucose transporter nac isoform X2 n=1 Tax=Tachypleus tridentatus TaxID=6853 RepID=UPI003FD3A2F2
MLKMELPEERSQKLIRKYIHVVAVVSAYWVISISMVFVNKHLLSSPQVQVFPLSFIFVGMISFNNFCLKYVGVPFYYVGRSLTTVFNVVLTYFLLQQKTSMKAVTCCAVIIIGFLLGVDQEGVAGSLSVVGVVYGVLASLFVSLYSIFTKKVLPVVDGNVWLLTFYNNLIAAFLFLPLMYCTGEIPIIVGYKHLTNHVFWGLMMMGGACGLAVAYITVLQIKVTSPLTHNISGTAKSCAQTLLAVTWFHEVKPALWWMSNVIVLLGSAGYTRVKQQEMMQAHQEATVSKREEDKIIT